MNNNAKKFWNEAINLYSEKKYRSAISKFNKSLKLYDKNNDLMGKSSCLLCIGLCYLNLKNYEMALDNFLYGKKIAEDISYDLGIACFQMNIGILYIEINSFRQAINMLSKSLNYFSKINEGKTIESLNKLINYCESSIKIDEKLRGY